MMPAISADTKIANKVPVKVERSGILFAAVMRTL